MPAANTEDDFWALVPMRPGCWVWQGYKNKTGYGKFPFRGKEYLAHRLAMILTQPNVSDETIVMHTCDRRDCVNPAHLRLGTQAENIADMHDKGRYCKGVDVHTAKLTEDDVREIRRRYKPRCVTFKQLGKEFGVSDTVIYKIVKRHKWRHVE
jgi:hypothetical protein